jgi:dihydroorotate dehydrogenase
MLLQPVFYDPKKTYEQNFQDGPAIIKSNTPPLPRTIHNKSKFLTFEVNTPFGIPAGPLLHSGYVKTAFEYGFDVNVYKTQRSVPFKANEYPNVLYLDIKGDLTIDRTSKPLLGTTSEPSTLANLSITNSFGNPSSGPQFWVDDLKKALSYQKEGQLLIMSVVGTIQEGFSQEDYFNDFANTAKLANETGVKVIEVNLSCPNVANEGIICYNPEADEYICRKVKEAIGDTPLIVKLGYFDVDQEELLATILKKITPFVSGISAINTIPAPVVDAKGNQALPGPNRLQSGICGASIQWAGLSMVEKLNKLRDRLQQNFEIIGVGGVMNSDDYLRYREKGADLVQSATGAMWSPHLGHDVWEKTKNYDVS